MEYLSLMPTGLIFAKLESYGLISKLRGVEPDLYAWVDNTTGTQHTHGNEQARRCALKLQPEIDRLTSTTP